MTWTEIRERLSRGESVPIEELAAALATGPLPDDLRDASVSRPRSHVRGRPPSWSDGELETIGNLCFRVSLWSEIATATQGGRCCPLTKEEVLRRVGAVLRSPMKGKSLANLLRRRRRPRPPGLRIRIFRDEDFARVLLPESVFTHIYTKKIGPLANP